jgi:hypothetical protein
MQLFRRWRNAAGPALGRFVPAAPFAALTAYGIPGSRSLFYDEIAQQVAAALLQSLEGQAVIAGEAAFVIDLPGPISLSLGYHLQQANPALSPVLLFNGFWRPGGVLEWEGNETVTTLAAYGAKVRPGRGPGYAFLLERERYPEVDPLRLIHSFDNRYHIWRSFSPVLPELNKLGINGLIDLRKAGDALPGDLAELYEEAAKMGIDIFQTVIN